MFRNPKQKIRFSAFGLVFLLFVNFTSVIPVNAATPQEVAVFRALWARTDDMVYDGLVNQTWVWGPKALDYVYKDKYRFDTSDKYFERAFRHYDKGRMEIDPRQPVGNKWYIRSSALVKELVMGRVQTGEEQEYGPPGYYNRAFPAEIPVVGDPVVNNDTPTYATFTDYATLNNNNKRADQRGTRVTKIIDRFANTDERYNNTDPMAVIETYESVTGHNVPVAFSRFMSSQGQILQNGSKVTAPLFDPIWHFGFPISEPYWARVKVNGVDKLVMLQLFERRVLSYTPGNPPGWQVEMGNVGAHYLRWRSQHDLTFSGAPRISLEKFTSVLRSYKSPVLPEAEDLYNTIVNSGLDPGVALAFFVNESGAGTAVGYCDGKNSLDNKNWGNARGDRSGACGFQKFNTWKDGLVYWCRVINNEYIARGLDRLEKAVPVYAPVADGNDVNQYLKNVYFLMYRWQGYNI
jgi:hypothetical protein